VTRQFASGAKGKQGQGRQREWDEGQYLDYSHCSMCENEQISCGLAFSHDLKHVQHVLNHTSIDQFLNHCSVMKKYLAL
jgi:hypothetical protein